MGHRVDALEKVTGKARFAEDLAFPGLLHARPVHSAHPHALVEAIRLEAARRVPGVVAVLTAVDVPGAKQVGGIRKDHYVLAADRVRYVGDVVALVAAETPEAAAAGAAAVEVDYRPLPSLRDPEAALRPGAPAIHDAYPDNLVCRYHIRHGDAAAALAGAARIVEREFRTQYIEHAYLEPEGCVAVPEADGGVTVRGGMQHPFTARRFTAWALGLPLAAVRIVQTTLGGGFGGKDDTIALVCARAALLARRTGRPVRLVYTREESIRESYKRHPFRMRYRVGLAPDGRLAGMEVRILADAGAYCSTTPFVAWRPTVQCTGPYRVPAVFAETEAAYTNGPLTGAMRGFGSPQINFAIESVIDDCAAAAGRDPLEYRLAQVFTPGYVTHTGQPLEGHTVSIAEVLRRAAERSGWAAKRAAGGPGRPGPDGRLRGIGLACSYRGVSLGAEGNDFCSAVASVQPDGSVTLDVGVSENGQGLKTVMVDLLAGDLGIPRARIRFIDTDTSRVPDGGPTVASRGTLVGGNAVLDAGQTLRRRIAETLSAPGAPFDAAGGPPPELRFTDGRVTDPAGGRSLAWDEAVAACHARRVYLHALGTWRGPAVSWDEERGQGNAYFTYVYGCNVAEVTVDPATGAVEVERLTAVHDLGRALFPEGVRGQILGGLAMALGFALHEELEVDPDGRILSLNFDRYRIPKATGMPALDYEVVENPDPAGPHGAKSLGEPVNELAAAAVANAVFHASGVRLLRLPLRPADLRAALRGEPCPEHHPHPASPPAPPEPEPPAGPPRTLRLRVNGADREARVDDRTWLIDVLRDQLGLTGTKRGCGIGQCGTCTVLLDGKPRRACRLRAARVGAAEITTIEGLAAPDGGLHPLQQAFIDAGAVQCGFCTPGMILAAKALLDREPNPSRERIRKALAGQLCRCTGYEPIVEAIERAAALLRRTPDARAV